MNSQIIMTYPTTCINHVIYPSHQKRPRHESQNARNIDLMRGGWKMESVYRKINVQGRDTQVIFGPPNFSWNMEARIHAAERSTQEISVLALECSSNTSL